MSSGPDSASPHTQMATWSDRFGIHPSALETLRCGMEALGHPEENIQLLEALLNNASDAGIAPEWLEPPHAAEALGRLAYAAPFLVRYLSAHPAALTLGVLDNLEQGPALAPWVLFADPATAADLPEETFIQALRLWKYAGYVRFTARELLGFQTTQSTCREISRLAEGMIRMSFAHAFRRGVLSNGLPLLGPGELAAGGVVGMGKLGGQELNYSSDVDVIFIQEGTDHPCWTVAHLPPQTLHPDMDENGFWSLWETLARGMTTGEAGRFSSGEFYNRLARQSMRLLALPTQEGFGFRVDADLRPQGKSGLLAPTLNFMEDYYLRLGREWERTAMLKARLIAGPPRLGTAFSKIIQPFVFQRYLDYSALEGVAIVKHDINRMHQNALKGNIKLGRGGIRENEFLVQALQLLYGGKRPGLQVQGHAATVDALVKEKLIEPEDGQAMLRDYWRLRGVENRIQMVAEAQTHELPPDPAERRRVLHDFHPAFETRLPEVESALEATRERIAGRFETLFRGLGEVGFPEADLWQDAVRAHLPEADLAPSLEFINTLFSGVMTTRMGERCVFKLARLLTLPELYRLGTEPAFPRWLRFMEQIGNRNALYTLIDSNRGIVPWVSHIFSEGGVHAELLMRHPEFLESFFAITESWDDPREHFQTLLANAPDEEAFLLELQSSKAQHQIRILTQYLNPQAPGEHHRLLSDLADAVIEACLRYAWQKVGSRMGFPEGARAEPQGFAVVALGKLGSQEMRFSSDLDLVFLYRGEGRTDQGRSHYEFYTRLGQTLGNLLTSQTQFGRLYELDHRLRPFGTRSVLVPSLKAYEDFFSPEETGGAEIWNYQAFTRARFLCGEAALARDLIDRVAHTWQARHLTPEAVATAVQTMLERLVTQSAPNLPPGEEPALPLKFATGGLIGFEFLRQAHFLCARLTGPPLWEPPEPAPNLVEGLTDYESLGALDERLSFYIPRYGNRVRRSELERLAALRDRWHWDDVRRVWERMEARVIAGFQTLRG